MGGLFSGIGSAISGLLGGSANLGAISGGLSNESALAGDITNIAGTQTGYGTNVMGTAYNQYEAGATGQLTPAMTALSNEELTQANLGTSGAYSNLGLGGSTMESQDLAANQLQNEAEQANLEAQEETLGLEGLGTGNTILNSAASNYGSAANITQSQINSILAALGGGTSSTGGIPGLTGSGSTGSSIGGTGLGGLGTGAGTTTTSGDLTPDEAATLGSIFGV